MAGSISVSYSRIDENQAYRSLNQHWRDHWKCRWWWRRPRQRQQEKFATSYVESEYEIFHHPWSSLVLWVTFAVDLEWGEKFDLHEYIYTSSTRIYLSQRTIRLPLDLLVNLFSLICVSSARLYIQKISGWIMQLESARLLKRKDEMRVEKDGVTSPFSVVLSLSLSCIISVMGYSSCLRKWAKNMFWKQLDTDEKEREKFQRQLHPQNNYFRTELLNNHRTDWRQTTSEMED